MDAGKDEWREREREPEGVTRAATFVPIVPRSLPARRVSPLPPRMGTQSGQWHSGRCRRRRASLVALLPRLLPWTAATTTTTAAAAPLSAPLPHPPVSPAGLNAFARSALAGPPRLHFTPEAYASSALAAAGDILRRALAAFAASSNRPDLLGTLLFAFALYFGFCSSAGGAVHNGTWMRRRIYHLSGGSRDVATAVHTLPFLALAMLVDSSVRVAGADGTCTLAFAVAAAVWAGIYALIVNQGGAAAGGGGGGGDGSEFDATADADASAETDDAFWQAFCEFAARRLRRTGRCHFIDVRRAFRNERVRAVAPRMATLRAPASPVSDERLRRCIRRWAPAARRTAHGFYIGLSVVVVVATATAADRVNE